MHVLVAVDHAELAFFLPIWQSKTRFGVGLEWEEDWMEQDSVINSPHY